MSLADREWSAVIHGMVLGAIFLFAFAGRPDGVLEPSGRGAFRGWHRQTDPSAGDRDDGVEFPRATR